MRIGIDIRPIATTGLGRGLGIYTAQLVKHLLRIDPRNHYTLFAGKNQSVDAILNEAASPEQVKIIRLRRPMRAIFLWDQLFWGIALRKERIDVFHSPVYGVPLVCPCQRVLTIHDLTPLVHPEFVKKFRHHAVFRFNFFTGRFANRIITSSEHSKQDILRYVQISERDISVIFDGVSEQYQPVTDAQQIAEVRRRYHLPEHFLLYVGGFDENKNLKTLVDALCVLLQQERFAHLSLVLTGAFTPAAAALREFIADQGVADHVIFTDFVPETEIAALFSAAAAFVFPSFYEGFGLPPLEAMACGTPVIVSNVSSLPEVVGDAGIQVNPHSSQALSQAIAKVLDDPALRQEMRQKGLERARRFSWQETARKTLGVYEESEK